MKIENIINQIDSVDPEIFDRLDGRRSAMKNFAKFSGKIALASLPIAFNYGCTKFRFKIRIP